MKLFPLAIEKKAAHLQWRSPKVHICTILHQRLHIRSCPGTSQKRDTFPEFRLVCWIQSIVGSLPPGWHDVFTRESLWIHWFATGILEGISLSSVDPRRCLTPRNPCENCSWSLMPHNAIEHDVDDPGLTSIPPKYHKTHVGKTCFYENWITNIYIYI